MFLIRQSMPEDIPTLLKLARMVYFINLPADERIIADKIQHSRDCFLKAATSDDDQHDAGDESPEGSSSAPVGLAEQGTTDTFMFTMVDAESGVVIGTSQIKAHMGGPGNPNYSLKVSHREFYSASLGLGTTHLVARLHADESGPTEIGGLVLQPSFRGHKGKPGRFMSFVRFHFMALFRSMFASKIIAEMAPQVSSNGDNLFWDHIGRKFIPVKYAEADRFCQHNRAFIEELLPKEDLYLTLLPLEVLNQVAQVGPETVPARRMLERLGFQYKNFIDPFDGGPHVEAATDQISLVRDTRRGTLGEALKAKAGVTHRGIVSTLHADGEFRAVDTEFAVDRHGKVSLPKRAMELLEAEVGTDVGYVPFERAGEPAAGASASKAGGAKVRVAKAGKKPAGRKKAKSA